MTSRIAGTKIKVLNLYAGIGGNRKLWKDVEVTAIEINPDIADIYSQLYPNDTLIIDDAKEFLFNNFQHVFHIKAESVKFCDDQVIGVNPFQSFKF